MLGVSTRLMGLREANIAYIDFRVRTSCTPTSLPPIPFPLTCRARPNLRMYLCVCVCTRLHMHTLKRLCVCVYSL